MFQAETELLFPLKLVSILKGARGPLWDQLIDRISAPAASPVDQSAFILLMVRLDGCAACNADSFRAMRGCAQCARQAVRRFRGNDQELIDQFESTRVEVEKNTGKERNH